VNVLDSMKDRLRHAVSASCPDELHNARCAVIKVKDADRDEVVHRAILSIICQSINSPTVIRELGHACFPTVTDTFLVPWAGTVHSVVIPTLKDPFTGSYTVRCTSSKSRKEHAVQFVEAGPVHCTCADFRAGSICRHIFCVLKHVTNSLCTANPDFFHGVPSMVSGAFIACLSRTRWFMTRGMAPLPGASNSLSRTAV